VRYRGAPASIAKLIDAPRIRCAGADTSGTGRSSVPLEIMRSTVSHVDCRNISRARAREARLISASRFWRAQFFEIPRMLHSQSCTDRMSKQKPDGHVRKRAIRTISTVHIDFPLSSSDLIYIYIYYIQITHVHKAAKQRSYARIRVRMQKPADCDDGLRNVSRLVSVHFYFRDLLFEKEMQRNLLGAIIFNEDHHIRYVPRII